MRAHTHIQEYMHTHTHTRKHTHANTHTHALSSYKKIPTRYKIRPYHTIGEKWGGERGRERGREREREQQQVWICSFSTYRVSADQRGASIDCSKTTIANGLTQFIVVL